MKILGMETHMKFPFSKVKRTVQDLMYYTAVRANFRQRYKDGEALEYERLPGLTLSLLFFTRTLSQFFFF